MTTRRNPFILAAIVSGGALAAGAWGAPAHVRTCHGLPVTIAASSGDVHGTPRADVIALTGPAHVEAGAGNDIICGSRGDDVIDAGPGDDVVVGRAGADRLFGGPGRDRLFGDRGADHLVGGPGADLLMGGRGRDTVVRGGDSAGGKGEQQSGDVVVPGVRSISLFVDNVSLQSIYAMASSIGIVVGDATSPGAQPVVWSDFPPMFVNMIALDGQLAAYAAGSSPLMPGVTVQPTSTVNAWPGQQYSLVSEGAPTLFPAGQGVAGSVSVVNQNGLPAVTGLARPALINGMASSPSPMTATTLYGNMLTQMQVPSQTSLFLATMPTSSGQMIPPLDQARQQMITVRSSSANDTATVSFNINTGFSQD